MPRNKCLLMLSFLHLNNNHINIPREQPGHDSKIRPVYDHLRSNFQELYYPGENIAIDERMVVWRGILSFMSTCRKSQTNLGWSMLTKIFTHGVRHSKKTLENLGKIFAKLEILTLQRLPETILNFVILNKSSLLSWILPIWTPTVSIRKC